MDLCLPPEIERDKRAGNKNSPMFSCLSELMISSHISGISPHTRELTMSCEGSSGFTNDTYSIWVPELKHSSVVRLTVAEGG